MDLILTAEKLTKKYGNIVAVDGVSFEARRGEIFGLLGPNGAGKTTTIRLIATVLAPTDGTAKVAGYDILLQPVEVRKRIGLLTTDIGVYERFSGRENLEYFGRLYGMDASLIRSRINELAEMLDMGEFIDRRAGQFSTGMRQKLAIARSVIHNPEVIIFDEPTSGLDVLASQTVLAFMRKARSDGKCVIFSTHQMPDAERMCDRIAIIHRGSMVACDAVASLKSRTQTQNLEDAFLSLVADRTQIKA